MGAARLAAALGVLTVERCKQAAGIARLHALPAGVIALWLPAVRFIP